jgi:hypothetical protein
MLETTIVIIIIAGVALLAYCIKGCFASKCKRFKLGCLEIERDTTREQNLSQLKLDVPKISM